MQITKKNRSREKVIETHSNLCVDRLAFHSASPVKWTKIHAIGSSYAMHLTESELRSLYQRIGEVLGEQPVNPPGWQSVEA
jgi:hypothetical protein